MTKIAIIGGTGFAGGHIAAEATRRGHTVTSWSRSVPTEQRDGVTYRVGSVFDHETLRDAASESDVVVLATHAQLGERSLREALPEVLRATVDGNARLGVVGGAGSSLVAEGGPRLVDTAEFPEAYRPEALAHAEVLDALRDDDSSLDWFYVSPAAAFGAPVPVEDTGTYRTGGDLLVVGADGSSTISGGDFARAFVDEIEQPAHRRQRFTVGR